jgi:hypothetical protein
MTQTQVLAEICGWTAYVLSIGSYILLTKGIIKITKPTFHIVLTIVCLLYCTYGLLINSLSIISLDVTYGTLALIAVHKTIFKKAKIRPLKMIYLIEPESIKKGPIPKGTTQITIWYESSSPTVTFHIPGKEGRNSQDLVIPSQEKVEKIIRFIESNQV